MAAPLHSALRLPTLRASQCCRLSTRAAFPVLKGDLLPIHRHVYEANFRSSDRCRLRYLELLEKVKRGGGESAIQRHTQRNRKLLVRERLKMLLDDDNFLELSPFAGLALPYGDVPAAGCVSVIGRISGIWCVVTGNDATVKGGTAYPITVKKQLRAQEIAMQNRLPSVYLVDSGGAFLPLQAQLFPDKEHGGRTFYYEAIMSAMKIPQVAVVCGSCTAGGAYTPSMAEEAIIVDKIGTIFLGGPPLVKAATGENVTAEELGGAKLHSRVSGGVDHFAPTEADAFHRVRLIMSTVNFDPVPDVCRAIEEPLYNTCELAGLAPRDYGCTLDVRLILSRLVDGSKFLDFKNDYGTTLVTGFAYIEGNLVGIVASNGVLTHDASLKGSHFVQICNQRGIPLLFLQNTTCEEPIPCSVTKAEALTNRLKAQASMMAAVACSSVPKITLVIGGCHGGESFAMCGRSFSPNFFFLWPNAKIGMVDADTLSPSEHNGGPNSEEETEELADLVTRLKEESSAFYSSARLWDDGVILPQDTRRVLGVCLQILSQRKYERAAFHYAPLLRM